MARTRYSTQLSTPNARKALKQRREPYWHVIHEGFALGYRKGSRGGTWIGRIYTPAGGRKYEALGIADDFSGPNVVDFKAATARAREWAERQEGIDLGELKGGPYTVSQALADYVADYERRGGKAKGQTEATINAHIKPALGAIELKDLRRSKVQKWFHDLAEAQARVRSKKGKGTKHREAKGDKANAQRKRRATANRCLTVLKAALNLAKQNQYVASDDAWSSIKAFRDVDAPVIRYLTEAEALRLVNATEAQFRPMVQAALLTGCRYGELTALSARDYNPDAGVVTIRASKSGKPRTVVLTDEGREFFDGMTADKNGADLVFPRDGGAPWGKSHQQKPLTRACKAAKIAPAISFHILRHTHGSTLAMKGVPMAVIAQQLGHTGTRMTEKHYAHLSPSYVADTIRAHFPTLGIVPKSNVASIGKHKAHR